MKLFLDNLFFLGEIVSLAGLAWGAWLVLRESLAGVVFPVHKKTGLAAAFATSLAHPFRRVART